MELGLIPFHVVVMLIDMDRDTIVVVIFPNNLLVFGNLFLESSLSVTNIYIPTVSTRDLVDHAFLSSGTLFFTLIKV